MKQIFQSAILILAIQMGLVFPLFGQPSFTEREKIVKLENPDSWTMILLPDLQAYVKYEKNKPILDIIMTWIKTNVDELNIDLVMCMGDLVDNNTDTIPDMTYGGDQSGWQQWASISKAFEKLDNEIPYILCVGNHDMEMIPSRYSQFNSWFSPNRNVLTQNLLIDMFPNASGIKTMENAYYKFISPHRVPFLIYSLEFIPRDTVVQQVMRSVHREKYKDYKVIILTHTYLNADNTREVKSGYPIQGLTGEELWQNLILPSTNIEMVLSGHKAGLNHREHVGYRVDKNVGNKDVHQILFNAQWEGGGPNGNGGDGWIRILEFFPDKKTVSVRTFSPLFAISPATADKSLRREDYDEFIFELN